MIWTSIATLILVVFSSSCSYWHTGNIDVRKNSNTQSIVIFDSREYILSREPNYQVEQDFQNAVSTAFERAFARENFDARKSFSYSINPKGAIYPFSKVDVKCLVREDLRGRYAEDICSWFYEQLDKIYLPMKKEME